MISQEVRSVEVDVEWEAQDELALLQLECVWGADFESWSLELEHPTQSLDVD